ncbi:MAG: hypothetical protein H7221_07145 [Flavobacterium sp.]|nr:hypothetical protein [Flavobacterium sp.]
MNQPKVGNHYTIIGQTSQKLVIIIQLLNEPARRWHSLYNYWVNQPEVGNHYTIIG